MTVEYSVKERERFDEMKLFTRPKSFSEAIALVTNLSCLLGLRAFEYPRGHPRSLLSLIYFLFVFGIYFSGSFNIEKKYYSNVRLMKLEYFLYKILQYVIIVSVLLKMLLGWWHTKVSERNSIWCIINSFYTNLFMVSWYMNFII